MAEKEPRPSIIITRKRENDLMKDIIYLDNAATTRTAPEAVEAMLPYLTEQYGNPSSLYRFSAEPKRAIAASRRIIADTLGARENEIYFTSGGSEADNWAIKAAAEACSGKGKHIITTKIEHHAVLHTAAWLEKQGFEVTYLDVDAEGRVDPEAVEQAIRPDTVLISVMFANNEVGTIEPIREIGETARKHGILFHTDAVQAYMHVPINVEECHIDLLSASAHKLCGPRGIGFLYIRRGVKLKSFIHGGGQERGRRAGTENTPGIAGFGKAVELAAATFTAREEKERELRDYLVRRVLEEIPEVRVNGSREHRLANNANFSFRFVEGESLLILLDMDGICCSAGSACNSGAVDPSHVLLAMGLDHETAHSSIRITVGPDNTKEEMDYTADRLKAHVEKLRAGNPRWAAFLSREKTE